MVRRLVRHCRDRLPPTVLGWALAALCSAALWRWGYGALDLLVFVFALAGLVLFFTSSLVIAGAGLWLSRRLGRGLDDAPALELEAGRANASGFTAPGLLRLPLVRIEWSWRHPAGVDCSQEVDASGRLEERVTPRRRLLADAVERRIVVQGAFGLSRIAWSHTTRGRVRALPAIGALRAMPPVPSMAAGDALPHPSGAAEGDRMEIRRYQPGDSVRHILWKTYARTGQLNVRLPEIAVDRAQRTIAYLLTGPGDEPAAAAARVALERGLLGERWLFTADGAPEPTDTLEPALDAIAASGSFEPPAGTAPADGLRAFLAHPAVQGESHCLVFAAARTGELLADALDAAAGSRGAVSFVLATDGAVDSGPRPLWRRLLFDDEPVDGAPVDMLRTLLATLQRAGHAALLVDRRTGRSHGSLGAGPVASRPLRRAG